MLYNDPITEVRLSRFEQRQLDQRLEVLRLMTPAPAVDRRATAGLFSRFSAYLGQIRPLTRRAA